MLSHKTVTWTFASFMIFSVPKPILTTQEMLFNDCYKMNLQWQLHFSIWSRGIGFTEIKIKYERALKSREMFHLKLPVEKFI